MWSFYARHVRLETVATQRHSSVTTYIALCRDFGSRELPVLVHNHVCFLSRKALRVVDGVHSDEHTGPDKRGPTCVTKQCGEHASFVECVEDQRAGIANGTEQCGGPANATKQCGGPASFTDQRGGIASEKGLQII